MLQPDPGRPANNSLKARFASALSSISAKPSGDHRKILILNGHPDPRAERFCAALCRAYADGARSRGWESRELSLGSLPPAPNLVEERKTFEASADIAGALEAVRWANRLIVAFPLWLNGPPPLVRRFFDDVVRMDQALGRGFSALGRSERVARIVVTMELPAFAHRLLFRAKAPAESPMTLTGLKIEHATYIGSVDTISSEQRAGWLQTIRGFGVRGD